MPFDTTYFKDAGGGNSVSYTVPGGIDTTIYLNTGGTPPNIQVIETIDSLVQYYQGSSYDHVEKNTNFGGGAKLFGLVFTAIFIYIIFQIIKNRNNPEADEEREEDTDSSEDLSQPDIYSAPSNRLVYDKTQLQFSDEVLTSILTKRNSYFVKLTDRNKGIFLDRVNQFMHHRTFVIFDNKGFREMPVLISGAAVQLSFGLTRFMLPNYTVINVYPQEFLRVSSLHFLEGNVQGNCINFSWKHFLDGFAIYDDGQNVGLHEMAHALYAQTFLIDDNTDKVFEGNFHLFNNCGKTVFDEECTKISGLYSDYAKTKFQEFWAESIELFFEKPTELKELYPELYQALCSILNQDPVNNIVMIA